MSVSALPAAYATARYRIDCGSATVERSIGRADPEADSRLAGAGCRHHWHILTPCNPGSRAVSEVENATRLDALRADLSARQWRSLAACNRAEDGSWDEPGFCVLDVRQDELAALARKYGQLAFVDAALGSAPQLIWTAAAGD